LDLYSALSWTHL